MSNEGPPSRSSRPPADPSGADRRIHGRAPIELRVEYKRVNSFIADYTRNISKGGTFIVTDKPLAIGTEFVFKLDVPHLSEPLALKGKVAWTVSTGQATTDQPAGMGIRFQYADPSERTAVQVTVEKLVMDSLGPFLGKRLLDLGDEPKPGS